MKNKRSQKWEKVKPQVIGLLLFTVLTITKHGRFQCFKEPVINSSDTSCLSNLKDVGGVGQWLYRSALRWERSVLATRKEHGEPQTQKPASLPPGGTSTELLVILRMAPHLTIPPCFCSCHSCCLNYLLYHLHETNLNNISSMTPLQVRCHLYLSYHKIK